MNDATTAIHSDDEWLVVTPRIRVPVAEFTFNFMRSSGPGGQNVNKVNTKVRLRWPLEENESLPADVMDRFRQSHRRRITSDGDFLIASQRYRDQQRNIIDCMEKLRDLIAQVAEKPKPRKPTKPSRGSKERRIKQKKQQSEKKQRRRQDRFE